MNFKTQFENLKKLSLPTDQFVVVSSGALSVRNIRESSDLDLMVTQNLWNELTKKYSIKTNDFGIDNIELENNIEILNPTQSIFGNSEIIPFEEIFEKADVFDGVKFINLLHLKKIKQKLAREKDLQDVELIDAYLSNFPIAT